MTSGNSPTPGSPPSRSPSPWILTVILLGLALGAALAWSFHQSRQCQLLSAKSSELQIENTLLIARRADLATLLSDPRTQLIRLTPVSPLATRSATVAWNSARQTGALFADSLPPAAELEHFILWNLPPGQSPIQVARFHAAAGSIAAPFSPAAPLPDSQFILTLQPASAATAPSQAVLFRQSPD